MITANSKEVRPGDTFLAVKGDATDGARFIQSAIDAGAVRIAQAPLDGIFFIVGRIDPVMLLILAA